MRGEGSLSLGHARWRNGLRPDVPIKMVQKQPASPRPLPTRISVVLSRSKDILDVLLEHSGASCSSSDVSNRRSLSLPISINTFALLYPYLFQFRIHTQWHPRSFPWALLPSFLPGPPLLKSGISRTSTIRAISLTSLSSTRYGDSCPNFAYPDVA